MFTIRRIRSAKVLPRPLCLSVVVALALAWISGCDGAPPTTAALVAPPQQLAKNSFDGPAAYSYLKQICAIGPRYSGSKGMREQQSLLVEHFQKLGAKVTRQEFQARHPQ
jgi:hypothetical protein